MTLAIFTGSLLGAMAIGMPIAYALLVCAVALMYYLDMFDAQIVAQNVINGADSFPVACGAFLHAGRRDHEYRRAVETHRQRGLAAVGHVKGGLGYVAIIAACILSAPPARPLRTPPPCRRSRSHDGGCRP